LSRRRKVDRPAKRALSEAEWVHDVNSGAKATFLTIALGDCDPPEPSAFLSVQIGSRCLTKGHDH
jgi:hypothetical protein